MEKNEIRTYKKQINILITPESYELSKAKGLKQAYIFEEGLRLIVNRPEDNNDLKREVEDLKKSNEKLYKINNILSEKLFRAEKSLKEKEAISDLEVPN